MTFSTLRSVASGKPYPVREVSGRRPRDLADFAGQTDVVLDLDGEDYAVHGVGVTAGDVVRVFEKDEQGFGKDVRVWAVRQDSSAGAFTAEHVVS
jgi:hypothetical protein